MPRKQAQRKAAATALPCTIESPTALGKLCAAALTAALELDRVVPSEVTRSYGAASLYFHGIPPVNAEIEGENRPILPMTGAIERWLHVAVDLRATGGLWHVRHVSVGLLKGDLAAPSKRPLLRAEWMMTTEPENAGHAQPHWHVLGAAEADDGQDGFAEFVAASSAGFGDFLGRSSPESPDDDIEKESANAFHHFHYAMVSDWHCVPSTGAQHALDDQQALAAWLKGCVSYIRQQLAHIDRKAKARGVVSP